MSNKKQDHERRMFGRTIASLDEVLADKSPRDIAMFAMSVLSDAQEMIQRGQVTPSDANTVRQLMNMAKYAIDKAVPR